MISRLELALWLAGALGGAFFIQHYIGLREAAAENEAGKGIATTTIGTVQDGAKINQDLSASDTKVAEAAGNFENNYARRMQDDPDFADRARRDVPQFVRDEFRARRLARERSGCISGKCAADGTAAEADERP